MEPINITLYGRPITKKNSLQIIKAGRKRKPIPSKQLSAYEEACLYQLLKSPKTSEENLNMRCLYYMPTRHRVDLVNLLQATCDILVKAKVIKDDNFKVIAGHDGSRVLYDKENPRVEITLSRGAER